MRRSIAAVATLALLTTALTGTTPASAEPARSSAAAPFTLGAPPQEYELQMRANGTEQRVLAQAAAEDKKANKPPKGKPATGKGGQGGSAMRTACTFPCYFYTTFYQDFTADPADATSADMMVAKPYVDSALHITAHSLGQAAIESQDGRDIVELGWIVDKNRRADGNPTLFAAHWIDNVFKGYDTAWVDYASNPVNLGAGLPKPVSKHFEISQTSTAFWAAYDGAWVAYVPKSRWTPGGVVRPFNAAVADIYTAKWFLEMAVDESDPCTDLGTGTLWNATGTPTPPITTFNNMSVGGSTVTLNWTKFGPNITGVWGGVVNSSVNGDAGGPGYTAGGAVGGTAAAC